MLNKLFLSLLLWVIAILPVSAQVCTGLGQNPSTAFPVCGTTNFNQGSVPICGGTTVPSACSGTLFTDKNPYWYRFTCFAGGTLGFKITPININDDYDWQLFDITGRNPNDVFTVPSLFVACNWSGEGGITGASSAGTSLVRCDGPGIPLFSSMPTLLIGHTYILLVSHFTDSQVGYSLSFDGGTANITDPLPPHLESLSASCDAKQITVKLNKKMKCNSLALNGSDFSINSPGINIVSATGTGCTNSFDMSEITLTLSTSLTPGNYQVSIKPGTDGNTLLDNCDQPIPDQETLSVTIVPLAPTDMDSLTTPGCAPNYLELVFDKPILCSSIAANGSDFKFGGPYPVSITSTSYDCVNGGTTKIRLQLSTALYIGGNFELGLTQGTDGNTLVDFCSQETPAGTSIFFTQKDTVNADFNFSINYGCTQNIVNYNHNAQHGVTSWQWDFNNGQSSTIRNPIIRYDDFRPKETQLIVSNGVCSDTSKREIVFSNFQQAYFESTSIACPNEPITFKNLSTGNISSWSWDFGNGITSTQKDPPAQYYPVQPNSYTAIITLVTSNGTNCKDTFAYPVQIVNNCFIAVPSGFTPNNDGLNDFLYPLNAYKARNLNFSIYNRFGQRIFQTDNWTNKWDGRFKGEPAHTGTYVWVLSYTHADTGQRIEQKGTTVLIR